MGGYNRKASVPTPRAPKLRVHSPEDRTTPAWRRAPPPTSAERSATRADTRVYSCIRPRTLVQAIRLSRRVETIRDTSRCAQSAQARRGFLRRSLSLLLFSPAGTL